MIITFQLPKGKKPHMMELNIDKLLKNTDGTVTIYIDNEHRTKSALFAEAMGTYLLENTIVLSAGQWIDSLKRIGND